MIDFEGNYYLCGVERFIAHHLKKKELRFVHDRLADLKIDDSEEISELKEAIEEKECLTLRNELADLMADCL